MSNVVACHCLQQILFSSLPFTRVTLKIKINLRFAWADCIALINKTVNFIGLAFMNCAEYGNVVNMIRVDQESCIQSGREYDVKWIRVFGGTWIDIRIVWKERSKSNGVTFAEKTCLYENNWLCGEREQWAGTIDIYQYNFTIAEMSVVSCINRFFLLRSVVLIRSASTTTVHCKSEREHIRNI